MMAISLLAEEKGLGSCILGAIDKNKITEILDVEENLSLMYLIGLGYSDGESSYYDSDEEIKYSINDSLGFNVPKRKKESIIIKKHDA